MIKRTLLVLSLLIFSTLFAISEDKAVEIILSKDYIFEISSTDSLIFSIS